MAEDLKRQIKSGQGIRRQTRTTTSNGDKRFVITLQKDYEEPPGSTTLFHSYPGQTTANIGQSDGGYAENPPLRRQRGLRSGSVLDLAQDQNVEEAGFMSPPSSNAWDLDFVILYLDYAFPFLFPFYHPPMIGTGRGWLLKFIRQSKSVFCSVLSLSSYFLTIGLKDAFPGKHDACKSTVWEQTLEQADQSFAMIEKELHEAKDQEGQQGLVKKACLMQSIIQLLIFESFLGKSNNWVLHLTPAVALFESILHDHSSSSEPDLTKVLNEMAWPERATGLLDRPLWNPDQAAFRFFTAILIYVDIIASTSTGRAPALRKYHTHTVVSDRPQDVYVELDLSSFMGCQNWVLLAIGDIAELYAWKREMTNTTTLSVAELTERARSIHQRLQDGVVSLSDTPITDKQNSLHRFSSCYCSPESSISSSSFTITRIWAHAARIYLSAFTTELQTTDENVHQHVSSVLILLEDVMTGAQLRALAWPICVASCLADVEQRRGFRELFSKIGDDQSLNTLREAWEIIQAVWARLDTNCQNCDFVDHFQILNRPVLLV
ncbi:hypothetical protein NM208_g3296 [Fusarium decemcellulare]|uniref:Uncharacterized protein n=1 Tax=Fusarium decemcellulare TaxID=57161 RepID=A0ACC1SPR9_9HYPO|nr:hypothetical protein NM208_g3296 [Fusarium decemcellulare]